MSKISPAEILSRLTKLARHEQIMLAVVAIFVGLLGGMAAVVFREAIAVIQTWFYGYGGEGLASHARIVPWWQILLMPAIGGLIVGFLVRYFLIDQRPHGVADVIESAALLGGRMRFRSGVAAALVSAISLGCGGSAGREGPVVHLAAVVTSTLSRKMRFGRPLGQTLLGCGVASGVAASFNAPFAGIFFALEVVTGNYALASFTPIVISSVTGTLLSRAYFGDVTAFIIPVHEIASFWEFPAFAMLGVISAIVAISLTWSVGVVQKTFARIPVPGFLHPAMGGLAIGLIALMFPQVLGVGYEATDQALNEVLPLSLLILLVVMKTTATAITLGSGFGGGVFSPSLFLGAMLGGAYGIIATHFFPHLSSGHGAYTIVGMGAVAGAVLGAPISTILMVFELTRDYTLTIAVMIATVISSQIATQLFKPSFFVWGLEKRGINLAGGRESRVMRSRKISDVMCHDVMTVYPDSHMDELREKLKACRYGELFLIDDAEKLLGTIMLSDMADLAFDASHDDEYHAADMARMNPPVICVKDDLETAMNLIEGCGEEHVAVVDSLATRKLMGVLHERDIMLAYHMAVLETRAEERI